MNNKPNNKPARTLVLGDVHGCIEELDLLLTTLAPVAGVDEVVFCGDLVDKGPHSALVVKRARALRESGVKTVLVLGNHEEKHGRFRARLAKGGDVTVFKGYEEMTHITGGLSPEDVDFLNTAVLFHCLPEHGATVVHAGVTPNMRTLPNNTGVLSRKERDRLADACRVRFVRPSTGSMVPLGEEQDGDVHWTTVYDGRFGHVYFGHEPFMGAHDGRFPNATGLDTGAVFGGRLTAAVLVQGQEVEFVTVPALARYAVRHYAEFL
jgi:predicted phosphodiesterase